jgi:phenylacetate-CoA ligase
MDWEKYYHALPIIFQNLTCSLEGWRLGKSRFGGEFPKLLQTAESRTFWDQEEMQQYRDQRLYHFIRHCYDTVPFYRGRFQKLGISPDDIKNLEDLRHLPILSKSEVQDNYSDMVSEIVPRQKQLISHTSGTTGGGLRFATTVAAIQEQWAIWWRYRHWHGIQMGTWCGYFGGRSIVPIAQKTPPFWRYNYPGKQILFSGYHLSPDNLEAYVNELRQRRPPWLHGYPSLLTIVASHLLETENDLGYRLQWVTIGAENLLPQQSRIMEQAFGVRPLQHYGMAEAVANISECEYGTLHVDEDFAAVEFVPNWEGPGLKIVGTNFTNFATPLLRYDIEDIIKIDELLKCPCGRPGRIVAAVDGRKEDYIVLKHGARLGRMDHIFKDLINIREAQLYQSKPGEIIVRVVRGNNFTKDDETMLLQEMRKRVGADTDIDIHYLESLPRSRIGKLRFVVSEISEGKLAKAELQGN